jgi:hypothetical protein
LTTRQLIPPPAADEYLVKRRRREVEEEQREASTRRRNSVIVLADAGMLRAGEKVTLDPSRFTEQTKASVAAKVAENADCGTATYTGESLRTAFRWHLDGEKYSCSGLTYKLLTDLGYEVGAIAGPDYWCLSDGRTLYEAACEIEDQPIGPTS